MDILLVDPPYNSLKGALIEYGYNPGLTSLAAYLRKEGIETAVLSGDLLVDSLFNNRNVGWSYNTKEYATAHEKFEMIVNDKSHFLWKKFIDVVRQSNPKAVGISYYTPLKCVVERMAGLIRETDKDIKIIAGSYHPTFCPEEVMQNPDIDFVARGEGEIPLLNLVKELKKDSPKWEMVPGIHYRDRDGQLRNTPRPEPLPNLDELPFLARDLVLNCDFKKYRGHSTYSARGCPYSCYFCADNEFWGGKVRRRSVKNVIEELRLLEEKYNASVVDFVDGTFTYDRNYLQAFCNAMIDHKLNIKWRCTARCDNLDEELLQLMKRSNCSGLYLGLESGSERILKSINKKETVEKLVNGTRMVYKAGIPSVSSIMLGLPGENVEDAEDTLKLIQMIRTDFIDVNCYVPMAGTPLYDSMTEDDKKSIDWRKVAIKSFNANFSKSLSQEDFKKYQSRTYKIANDVRRKTIVRYGARMFLNFFTRKFRKS